MGALSDTAAAVETMFKNGWGSRTPLEWDNVRFQEPTDDWRPDKKGFVRFSIQWRRAETASPGTQKLERQFGEVRVAIYVPKNIGSAVAMTHADAAAAIFRNVQVSQGESRIQFRSPWVDKSGKRNDRYELVLLAPFEVDRLV